MTCVHARDERGGARACPYTTVNGTHHKLHYVNCRKTNCTHTRSLFSRRCHLPKLRTWQSPFTTEPASSAPGNKLGVEEEEEEEEQQQGRTQL